MNNIELLCNACENNNLEIIKNIINKDKDIIYKCTNDYNNCFLLACKQNNLDIIKYIISIDINIINITSNIHNMNGFIIACIYDSIDVIKYLLDLKKKLIYSRCLSAMNGFMYACYFDNINTVSLLLNIDNNICYTCNNDKDNGFVQACIKGNINIIRLLLTTSNNNLIGNGLLKAAKYGFLSIIKIFIEYNEKLIDYMSKDLFNVFIVACIYGHLDIVKYLYNIKNSIIYSSNINKNNGFLFACANSECIEIVEWFVSIDKTFKFNCNYGLISALINNNEKIVELLILDSDIKKKTCSICLTYDSTIITDCNHQYCYQCLSSWIKHNNKCKCSCSCIVKKIECPLCRNNINNILKIKN